MSYVLGIDVGATRTSAATTPVVPGPRDAEIVDLGLDARSAGTPVSDRSGAIPTVLHLGEDGSVAIGERAGTQAVRDFKRRIGDPAPIHAASRVWTPEDLTAGLVRWVVDRVTQRRGGPPSRIAVTHPAAWGKHQLDLFRGALTQQGLSVVFLSEPQAAALQYAASEWVDPGSAIAVYDLGGATADATVLRQDAGGAFSVIGRPESVDIGLDDAMVEYVRARDVFATVTDDAALRRACLAAKEALSTDTEATIPLPGAQTSVRLRRNEFEAMIRPRLEETAVALRRAIAAAGCTPDQLSAVLLVGGSCRIPLVAELVAQQLGRPVVVDPDPQHAVAKGAALALVPAAVPLSPVSQPPMPVPLAPVPLPRSDTGVRTAVAVGASSASPQGSGRPGTPAPPRSASTPMTGRPQPERPSAEYAAPLAAAASGFGGRRLAAEPPPLDLDPADRPRRAATPALLVSAGGAASAVAVIAAAFLLPHTSAAVVPAGLPASQLAAVTSPTPTPTPTPTPVRTRKPEPVRPPVVTTTRTTPPETTGPQPTTTPSTSSSQDPSTKPTEPEDPARR